MLKKTDLLPYEEAKREFVELFGTFVKRDHFKGLVAILSLLIAISCIAFAWYASNKIQTREIIVSRDKFGLLTPLSDSNVNNKIDNQVIAANLGQYIENIRTITSDNNANSKLYLQARKLTNITTWQNIKEGIAKHWASMGDGNTLATTVSVDITSVMELSKNTWSIEWKEYTNGVQTAENTTYWKAIATIETFTPNDADSILNNPAGIIVKQLNITQVLNTYRSN